MFAPTSLVTALASAESAPFRRKPPSLWRRVLQDAKTSARNRFIHIGIKYEYMYLHTHNSAQKRGGRVKRNRRRWSTEREALRRGTRSLDSKASACLPTLAINFWANCQEQPARMKGPRGQSWREHFDDHSQEEEGGALNEAGVIRPDMNTAALTREAHAKVSE